MKLSAKLKSIFILVLTLGITSFAYAQNPATGRPEVSHSGGSIWGRVISQSQKEAMQYTNVVLYKASDSTMVTGSITDKEGIFKFENLKSGKYYLKIHFIGFKIRTIGNLVISQNHRSIRLPDILMKPATATLKDVNIKASQPRVSYQIDKKVVDVSKDLTAVGGTAIDALQNVPSVNVDLQGNVTLRGSSNFTVLINGRPSILSGSDALEQIPASDIKSIEIITNPSAKYDPEGVGGIINVILKKNRKMGLNGMFSGSVGNQGQYNGNMTLAYKKGKINYMLSVDGHKHPFKMHQTMENAITGNDTTSYRDSKLTGDRYWKGISVKGGMDIQFTKKTDLTLSARVGGFGFGMDHNSKIHAYDSPNTYSVDSNSVNNSNRWAHYYGGQIDFLHKFNDLGHQIEAYVFYSGRQSDDKETQDSYLTDANWTRLNNTANRIQTDTRDTVTQLRMKLDYTLPIGIKGKFDAGANARVRTDNGIYDYQNYDTTTNSWNFNPANSSTVVFDRQIFAAYVSFKDAINNFGYEVGFRGEYTGRKVNTNDGSGVFKINRFDYFPSIYLSYKFNHNYQIYTSYTRRIDRPRGWDLNPFPRIIDSYNIRVGNPKLLPEYINSYELGMQKSMGPSFISLEGYYRIGINHVSDIITQENGILYHTNANLNKDYSGGVEAMADMHFAKFFSFNLSGTIYNERLTGNITGQSVVRSSTNWRLRLTPEFDFHKNFRVQLMGVYRGPTATIQGSRKGFFYTSLALRKDLLNKKLNIVLSARNVLGTAKWDNISSGPGFYNHSTFQPQWPMVRITVNYFLNNYKQKRQPQQQQVPNGPDSEQNNGPGGGN